MVWWKKGFEYAYAPNLFYYFISYHWNYSPPIKCSAYVTGADSEDDEYCPIEQVRLTVPATDDPTVAALTFRTWFLGIITCVMLAFTNQFFGYRQNALAISSVAAQIVTLPVGKFMARVLPTTTFRVPAMGWSFSLNPGPFSLKEHVLITIFANCGAGGVYALSIVTIVKALYHRPLHPLAAWFLVQTTQVRI